MMRTIAWTLVRFRQVFSRQPNNWEAWKKPLEWIGVATAIFYSLFVAANLGLEFWGFALLFLSAIILGVWSYLCQHKAMFLLQFFYAAAGILGMIRWF